MQRCLLTLCLLVPAATSCQSAYYSIWETVGVHKRDILVDRVEEGRDAQEEAKKEFVSAMETFKQVTGFKGGDLEKVYSKIQGEYDDCAARVDEVHTRIGSIEKVAGDLFEEWKAEMKEYSDASLRRRSEEAMDRTRDRYKEMIGAMKRAESKMQPVLAALKDRALFLKHNLNAQAIASLSENLGEVEKDVSALVAEMERSIDEANQFIAAMKES